MTNPPPRIARWVDDSTIRGADAVKLVTGNGATIAWVRPPYPGGTRWPFLAGRGGGNVYTKDDAVRICTEWATLRGYKIVTAPPKHEPPPEMTPAAMRDEIERLGTILTAERTDRGADYERGKRDGDAEMMREVVRLRGFTAALSKLLGDAGLLEDGPVLDAHLLAVQKLIERTTATPKPAETT